MPQEARVWIYASNEPFTDLETDMLNRELNAFTDNWESHHQALRAASGVFHQRFIVIMVDEELNQPGGCSLDKSVHLIRDFEKRTGKSLLNRMLYFVRTLNGIQSFTKSELQNALDSNQIQSDSIIFDNLVSTKEQWEHAWEKPLNQHWIWKQIQKPAHI